MDGYAFPGLNVETVVGNGRLIARAQAGSAEFIFAGPASRIDLTLNGEPVDEAYVETFVRPGRTRYTLPERGAVTYACQPDALLYLVLVEADAEPGDWRLSVEDPESVAVDGNALVTSSGRVVVWNATASAEVGGEERKGALTARVEAGRRAAFLLGDSEAVRTFLASKNDPFEVADRWEAETRGRGLRLRTPVPDLDLAVDFAKAHMRLGYDWRPDADGQPGGDGSKMVCDIFRWRDVWSRDFGSGFGPGGIVANLYDAVLATLDYEAERYASHDPAGLKVSDDTSQGGSAESLGWVFKLIWRVYKHTGDAAWLERITAAFEPWVELWISRDADEDGLVVDVTEWMDHSRFLRLVEGQRTLYSNALYTAALRRMALICDELDRDADAERYRDLAARSRQAIHDAFWNEAGYFNNAVQWGVPDTALMLADNAVALVERVASRNERFRTLETIKERSWRTFGTVTTDLPMKYVPADNDHNGKVWPWWMAHEAKARFLSFDAEGGLHVLQKIVDTFSRPTLPGLCEEYLNPDDGTQDDVVGHAFITGSGAMLDAVLYGLVGLSHVVPGDRHLRLAPATPRTWDDWRADIDLFQGALSFEQSTEGYRIALDGTRCETFEVRIPPREAIDLVTVDGEEVEPERETYGASEVLRFAVPPGKRVEIEVSFAAQRVWSGEFAMPSALPPPVEVARPLLMDEPRLFADVLQGFIRGAVSYFGQMRHVAARDIGTLRGPGDLLVIVGNELPVATKRGKPVPAMIEQYLGNGGSLLLLGPRFPRIDFDQHYHGGAQMGGHAGMFWWKAWRGGQWVDVDPRTEQPTDRPAQQGTVYWGPGDLFQAWEHGLGLFGFETDCRGVYDVEGGVVDPDQVVEVVYTDWTVRRPWRFTPLAFTQREHQLVTGPRVERYPCAALLENDDTGARIVVVAPALCSRADLLHRILGHVARSSA